MSSNILVVVAHPDDEVFGLGATLARHVDAGDRVGVMTLTNGVGARRMGAHAGASEEAKAEAKEDVHAAARRAEAQQRAAEILGIEILWVGNFPDNALDSVPRLQLIQAIEARILAFGPHCVYTHHPGDLNVDHRRCAEAVFTVCRPLPASTITNLRCFSTRSSTEWSVPELAAPFQPNCFVEVAATWERKHQAMQAYAEELRPFPHSRSLEALDAESRYWGAQVGVTRAEAFAQVRQIIRDGA